MDLLERMLDKENLATAYQKVMTNKGAAGPDGVTVKQFGDFLRAHWPRIKEELREQRYKPGAVRRVEIPKPDGGVRQLGIPNVIDRFIQQAMLQILTPILDPRFSKSSFGFRPNRKAHDAVRQAKAYVEAGYMVVVDIDLKNFFDTINHDLLMNRLYRQVTDTKILRLIRRYLRAGVLIGGATLKRRISERHREAL